MPLLLHVPGQYIHRLRQRRFAVFLFRPRGRILRANAQGKAKPIRPPSLRSHLVELTSESWLSEAQPNCELSCNSVSRVPRSWSGSQGSSTASLWMRNIQLGSFSLLLGLLAVVFKDGAAVADRGFFSGYSPMVWLCISLNSLGGLAVAMVVKYADNVVRVHPLYVADVCLGAEA